MIKELDTLVSSGELKSYSFRTLDMDGMPIVPDTTNGRETEEVTLVFSSGQTLVVTVGYDLCDRFTDYTREYNGNLASKQCIYCPGCGKKIAVCY